MPVIHINAANPAITQLPVSYQNLSATITGPQADLNLGIHTIVDGVATNPVAIDTTVGGTHSIDYVVTDPTGLTSTSTRTVIVSAPATNDKQATSSPPAANANFPVAPVAATGTAATSSAQ